jgi:predicted CoA-substrate-specific enzyme activase
MGQQSEGKLYFAGVDIGSNSAKSVIFQDDQIIGHAIVPTKADVEKSGKTALKAALESAGILESDLSYTVATGYGRISASYADEVVTEITCHAKGAHYFFPNARAIIDIGGQDSKAIKLDSNGNVVDFVMNDKCAAGTGKFLEVIARALEVSIDDLSLKTLAGDYACPINSTCAIFAESEVISLLASGEKEENIAKGLHFAVAKRVSSLFSRIGSNGGDRVFTGGVAKNAGLRSALEEVLGSKLLVSPVDPQLNGAVGAAILARTNYLEELEYEDAA